MTTVYRYEDPQQRQKKDGSNLPKYLLGGTLLLGGSLAAGMAISKALKKADDFGTPRFTGPRKGDVEVIPPPPKPPKSKNVDPPVVTIDVEATPVVDTPPPSRSPNLNTPKFLSPSRPPVTDAPIPPPASKTTRRTTAKAAPPPVADATTPPPATKTTRRNPNLVPPTPDNLAMQRDLLERMDKIMASDSKVSQAAKKANEMLRNAVANNTTISASNLEKVRQFVERFSG